MLSPKKRRRSDTSEKSTPTVRQEENFDELPAVLAHMLRANRAWSKASNEKSKAFHATLTHRPLYRDREDM